MTQNTGYKIPVQIILPKSGIYFVFYGNLEPCCRFELELDIINPVIPCYSYSKHLDLVPEGILREHCCFLFFEIQLDTVINISLSCPLRHGYPCYGELVPGGLLPLEWSAFILRNGDAGLLEEMIGWMGSGAWLNRSSFLSNTIRCKFIPTIFSIPFLFS